MIDKAILKINPNAECTINADDINQITWVNGTTPISKEDIEAMLPTVEQELKDAEQDAINKKASGKQKLLDLGLTEEEVKAIINI
jgi:transcriptional regulator NrdR family protein